MDEKMYDLDGTLSRLNNTWDFILPYLYSHSRFRYYLARAFNMVSERMFVVPYYIRRRWQIRIAFDGLRRQELEGYFESSYKQRFLRSLNRLGNHVLTDGSGTILTGCTEIPARQIARILNMRVICTQFCYQNKKIKGLKTDTYGNLKARYLRYREFVYYTDTPNLEKKLKPLLKEMIIVNEK